jgi:hypothetical protein
MKKESAMAQMQPPNVAAKRPAPNRSSDHPRSVATLESEPQSEQPFVEGAQDAIDPDLRHRLISEEAYRLYAERGYADGFDIDDWLQAEAAVDHLLTGAESKPEA